MNLKSDLRQILLIIVGMMVSLGSSAQGTTPSVDNGVIAETHAMSRKQGMVRIGKALWKCSDRRCTAGSRTTSVSVKTCQALAELVGPIARFGKADHPIESYDLALCNVRAQIKISRAEEARRRAHGAHTAGGSRAHTAALPINIPPVVQMPTPRPLAIRVERLSVAGMPVAEVSERMMSAVNENFLPVNLKVTRLELAGLGRMGDAVEGTYLTIAVPKLELVGR